MIQDFYFLTVLCIFMGIVIPFFFVVDESFESFTAGERFIRCLVLSIAWPWFFFAILALVFLTASRSEMRIRYRIEYYSGLSWCLKDERGAKNI